MKRFSIFLLCLVSMLNTFAWGPKGHRIAAQVAYDHLTTKTRKQVDHVLGTHGMVYLSTWPDEIKSDTIYPESHDWHYQDLDGGLSDEAVVATLTNYPEVGGYMFRALDSLALLLKNEPNNHDALVFYVHLLADRYCPMHVAHLDDKGGNAVRMKWFGQNTNLHSVWDSKIVENKGFSYTEYANYLHDVYGHKNQEILSMTPEQTLLYTYHLTSDVYEYQSLWSGNAYHYVYEWADEMEYQLYMAGVKLAQSLNQIYK
jgi:hypothetical protein